MSYNSNIAQYQQSLGSFVLGLPPKRRFWLGLFTSAALAHLAPIIIFAVLGQWTNNVLAFSFLAVAILFLMMLNLLGNKIKQIWLVNGLVSFLLVALTVRQMLHQSNNVWHGLAAWWATFAWVIVMCLLNAGLFLYYKRVAELP